MRAEPTTVRALRRANRARALWQLYLHGTLTRQQIGDGAGYSLATVSNVVGELLAEGLVTEVGLEDSNGGRPRTLVRINPRYGHVVGVDIGETAFLVELFDLGMQVLASHHSRTALTRLDAQDAVQHVATGIDRVLDEAGLGIHDVFGVGVGVPGLVEHRPEGAVVHGQSVGWHAVRFERLLHERLLPDQPRISVVVDNGAMALGQAESWFGAARGADHAVIALLGIGVGTGIVSGQTLYRGATSSAGEWGHTTIVVDGRPCRCGARGCLEAYVGGAAVVARYDELRGRPGSVRPRDLEKRVGEIVSCADDDPCAAQVLEETASYLGVGIANLANLIDPSRVVVGGWLGLALADTLLTRVRAAVAANALRLPASHLEVVAARLGPDAVALGAATLPVARFLDDGGVPRAEPMSGTERIGAPVRSGGPRRRRRAPGR